MLKIQKVDRNEEVLKVKQFVYVHIPCTLEVCRNMKKRLNGYI